MGGRGGAGGGGGRVRTQSPREDALANAEIRSVPGSAGEYDIIDGDGNSVVGGGMTFRQAEMELRMLRGENVDFEEYTRAMEEW